MKMTINKFLMILILLMGFQSTALSQNKAEHGMFALGSKSTYLVHMPMLHKPHNFQLILEVHLSCQKIQVVLCQEMQKYIELSKTNQLITLLPEPLDTDSFFNDKVTSFTADLFQGHFEKQGKKLGKVKVNVLKTIWKQQISIITNSASFFDEYVIFGKSGEYFTTHIIKNNSHFDYVALVDAPQSIEQNFPCRSRNCNNPIPALIQDKNLPVIAKQDTGIEDSNKIPLINSGPLLGNSDIQTQVLKIFNYESL